VGRITLRAALNVLSAAIQKKQAAKAEAAAVVVAAADTVSVITAIRDIAIRDTAIRDTAIRDTAITRDTVEVRTGLIISSQEIGCAAVELIITRAGLNAISAKVPKKIKRLLCRRRNGAKAGALAGPR